MPFPYVSGAVAGRLKVVRQRRRFLGKVNAVPIATILSCVETRLQTGASGAAYWLGSKTMGEVSAGPAIEIEIWGQPKRISISTYRVPALLIREENNDVRLRTH